MMTKRRRKEETSAQYEARYRKQISERAPREVKIETGTPVECPFCALTPAAAYANNVSMPMAEVRGLRPDGKPDVWLQCVCMDRRPVNVYEEELRRAELDRRGKDGRYDGWRRAHWEDTQGRFNPDQFTPQSDKSKGRKKKVPVNVRAEQEWQGFPGEEEETLERLQKLNKRVNVRVPAALVGWLNEKARYTGTTVSDVMRRLLEFHLIDLDSIPKLDRKRNRAHLHFCMTKQHQTLFVEKKRAVRCTTAELINTVILREIAG